MDDRMVNILLHRRKDAPVTDADRKEAFRIREDLLHRAMERRRAATEPPAAGPAH